MSSGQVSAAILAGSRPGGDPLAEANGASSKSLISVQGKPMLYHATLALSGHDEIRDVKILAQDIKSLSSDPAMAAMDDDSVGYAASSGTIADTIHNLLNQSRQNFPLLITTADNALLNSAMIDQFLSESATCDIAIAVVDAQTLLNEYPGAKRTWLQFSDDGYSGANLFLFNSAKASKLVRYWAEVEQDRKKGWRMLSIFGPWLLLQFLLRRLTIDQMADRVGKKLGLNIKIVKMRQAEACIDVDTQSDLQLVEEIMKVHQSST